MPEYQNVLKLCVIFLPTLQFGRNVCAQSMCLLLLYRHPPQNAANVLYKKCL